MIQGFCHCAAVQSIISTGSTLSNLPQDGRCVADYWF